MKSFFKSNFALGFISIIFFLVIDFTWVYSPYHKWSLFEHLIPAELGLVFAIIYHVWVVAKNCAWINEIEKGINQKAEQEQKNPPKNLRLELWSWAIFGFCYPYMLTALYTWVVCLQHGVA